MTDNPLPYHGWWRITSTGTWSARDLDGLGTGRVTLRKNGETTTFGAERAEKPPTPTPDPPDHRDKWRRRR